MALWCESRVAGKQTTCLTLHVELHCRKNWFDSPRRSGRAALPGGEESVLHLIGRWQMSQISAASSLAPPFPARLRSAAAAYLHTHANKRIHRMNIAITCRYIWYYWSVRLQSSHFLLLSLSVCMFSLGVCVCVCVCVCLCLYTFPPHLSDLWCRQQPVTPATEWWAPGSHWVPHGAAEKTFSSHTHTHTQNYG